jgi:hypothetical protein
MSGRAPAPALAVGDKITVIYNDQPRQALVTELRPTAFAYEFEPPYHGDARRVLIYDSEGWAWARGHDDETAGALAAAWALRSDQMTSGATGPGWPP